MYGLVSTADSPEIPFMSLEEAKLFLKVDFDDDNDVIEQLAAAAAEDCELHCNAAFRPRSFVMTLAGFPSSCRDPRIFLPRHPLVSVASVEYLDAEGDEQTLAEADYVVVASTRPAFLVPAYNKVWPATYEHPEAVTITFRAGFEDGIPRRIQAAVRFRLSQLYRHRDETGLELPASVVSLLASDRLWPLP